MVFQACWRNLRTDRIGQAVTLFDTELFARALEYPRDSVQEPAARSVDQ